MEILEGKYLKSVSLVTVVYNEGQNILRFLESYFNQEYYAEEFVIIDGGSEDSTPEHIEKFSKENPNLKIRLISDKKYSKGASKSAIALSRNEAIEMCSGKYIAITDAGCTMDKNWLYQIVKPFEEFNVDVVSGWYEGVYENEFQKKFRDIFLPKKEDTNADNFLPSSRSIALKKDCWKSVGGYPMDSYSGEDTKFDLLLKEKSCRFYFASDAVVYWSVPENVREACKKYYNYGQGDGYYLIHKVYYSKMIFHTLIPIKYFVSGDFNIKYRIYFSLLKGFMKGFWKRITE